MPKSHFNQIVNQVLYSTKGYFTASDGRTVVDCGDLQTMNQIQLLLNDKWVSISVNNYLIPIYTEFNGESRSTGMCTLCVEQSEDMIWHVGTVLLEGYYTQLDIINRQMHI